MQNTFDLSILIPAKDEAKRLPHFLDNVIVFANDFKGDVEIIVIDDGSEDHTSEVVVDAARRYSHLKLLRLPHNRGKGYAIKRAMFEARGAIIAFLDADGSTPVEEINRHLKWFEKGFDMIAGSRVLTDKSSNVEVLAYRKWIGIIFNALVHTFLIKDIKDTQCGFKIFRRPIVRELFGRIYLNRFGFDLEMFYIAKRLGLKVKEVPVNWHHVDGSKVDLIKDSWQMFRNIFQIRAWHPLPIQKTDPHMSVAELKSMYVQEKHHWWFRAKGWFMKGLLKNIPTAQRILDAGCGTGHNAAFIDSNGFYVGCDAVFEALSFCQKNNLNNLVQSNLTQLGFKKNSFDLIVCLDVIEHLNDDKAALMELKRLLSRNGALILAVPAWRRLFGPHDLALSHFRRYNAKDLKTLIADCGLSLEKTGYWYAGTFLPAVFMRWINKWIIRPTHPKSDTHKSPPKIINSILLAILRVEAVLQKLFPLPFGTTIFAIIKKD